MPTPPSTRDRLIAAAEVLFAERGVEAASLRDITGQAGTNLAAVNYHFGSKEGLLRAVLEARLHPINARRLELLEAIEASRLMTVERLLEAFICPTVDPELAPGEHFLQLMVRVHHAGDEVTTEVLGEIFGPVASRYLTALTKVLPSIPPGRVLQRMQFVIGAMIHSLFTKGPSKCPLSDRLPAAPNVVVDDEAYLQEFVAFCAAGLRHE